jgi:hypothetical protein
MQLPLFWQGLRISHKRADILQLEPIPVDVAQVGGRKNDVGPPGIKIKIVIYKFICFLY